MGRIEADIALESWLFGFQPCSGQGQFTLNTKHNILFYISSRLGSSINSQIFPFTVHQYPEQNSCNQVSELFDKYIC